VSVDVVETLYSCIEEVGRDRIRIDITSDIAKSESYCHDIIQRSRMKLGKYADQESLGTLCEAMLHFLLTVSLLPSERKVNTEGADLDLVIPSLKSLSRQPDKTLVIQIVKNNEDYKNKTRQAKKVQPYNSNIWVVSANPLNINYRNYHLGSGAIPYPRIISDIDAFLADKGVRGLKLLQGH
jgi:hypothetical protein